LSDEVQKYKVLYLNIQEKIIASQPFQLFLSAGELWEAKYVICAVRLMMGTFNIEDRAR